MKTIRTIICLLLAAVITAGGDEFRHIGDFIVKSRLKVSPTQTVPVPIKPLRLSVFTDGAKLRISTDGEASQASEFTIYRSDGIGQQRSSGGALEVVPGVQASSDKGGILKQIRLTRDSLTITSFPGVSDQIVITRAVLAPTPKATLADETAAEG